MQKAGLRWLAWYSGLVDVFCEFAQFFRPLLLSRNRLGIFGNRELALLLGVDVFVSFFFVFFLFCESDRSKFDCGRDEWSQSAILLQRLVRGEWSLTRWRFRAHWGRKVRLHSLVQKRASVFLTKRRRAADLIRRTIPVLARRHRRKSVSFSMLLFALVLERLCVVSARLQSDNDLVLACADVIALRDKFKPLCKNAGCDGSLPRARGPIARTSSPVVSMLLDYPRLLFDE